MRSCGLLRLKFKVTEKPQGVDAHLRLSLQPRRPPSPPSGCWRTRCPSPPSTVLRGAPAGGLLPPQGQAPSGAPSPGRPRGQPLPRSGRTLPHQATQTLARPLRGSRETGGGGVHGGRLWVWPGAEEPALPFQAWELHLPHPCQRQHPPAPQPDPADEVSAAWGRGDPGPWPLTFPGPRFLICRMGCCPQGP